MRAVILATSTISGMGPLLRYRPSCLLHIADKPIIFYVMESLSELGIKKCDLFISDFANLVEEKVGDGRRWGMEVTIYLLRDALEPFQVLAPTAIGWMNESILLGVGDCLPVLEKANLEKPGLFVFPDKTWTGWGVFPSGLLTQFDSKTKLYNIPDLLDLPYQEVEANLSTKTLMSLKQSNEHVLQAESRYSKLATARQVEPQVWLSRAVSMRKSTNIIPPVFIGENCQLLEDVQIGPNAIIENNCIIDRGSKVQNAIVCQQSYVGEGLSINDCIVDRNALIDLALDTHINIRDDFILSNLATPKMHNYPLFVLERISALILLIIFSPVLLLMYLFYPMKSHPFLQLPASRDTAKWKTFDWYYFEMPDDPAKQSLVGLFFQRLSVLINIVKGEVHFVGVAPRDIKDTLNLPLDRQNLYLKSKIGLITLSNLDHGPNAKPDEQYASETFYAVHMSPGFDLKLALRWMANKFKSIYWYVKHLMGLA